MKKSFLLIIIFLSYLVVNSQTTFLSFSDEKAPSEVKPGISILDNGLKGMDIEYTFPGVYTAVREVNEVSYQYLHINGFGKLMAVGKPALPFYNEVIAIPEGATAEVEIIEDQIIKYPDYLIHPALEPASDEEGAKEPEFVIDEVFYKSDVQYPEQPVKITEILEYKGVSLALIQICPVQYNPARKEITAHPKIKYRIKFSPSTRFINYAEHSDHSLNMFPNYVLNAYSIQQEIASYRQNPPVSVNTRAGKDFIIITHSNYIDAAKKLSLWKQQLGYSVELVSRATWTSNDVKNVVKDFYTNWNPKPDFLLIMGDNEQVPAQMLTDGDGNQYPTDLYYVCMGGSTDNIPDMAKGRIPAATVAEANLIVQKIIDYEKTPLNDADFYKNGLHCAQFQESTENIGYEERRFALTSEDILQYMTTKQGYTITRVYKTNSGTNPTNWNKGSYANGEPVPSYLKKPGFPWDGDKYDIRDNINKGAFYVLHRDHGSVSSWGTPSYSSSDISNLSNNNKLPVVFSLNCLTGSFHKTSFCETFIRKSNGGCVGIFGATNVSYSGYNDAFAIGLFDAIWPQLVITFTGSSGIDNPNINQHVPIYTLGDILNQGLRRMRDTWGSSKYTHELFHYFGDPAMKIWTALPVITTATHDNAINGTSLAIHSSNCPDGLATLVVDSQLIASVQLSGGKGTITFSSLTGDEGILTISNHNYKPYIAILPVNVVSPPIADFNAEQKDKCSGSVQFQDKSSSAPTSWLWNFGNGQTSSTQNPVCTYSSNGNYIVTLTVNNSYGSDIDTDTVLIDMALPPSTTGDQSCEGKPVTLTASGNGTIYWYDNLSGGNILGTGNTFITPPLVSTKTYYAENVIQDLPVKGGPANNNFGDGGNFNSNDLRGLVFDVLTPLVLKSVKVYSNSAGNRLIEVLDAVEGTVIISKTIAINAGESRITLDFPLEIGNNYFIKITGTLIDLYRNNTNAAFPYIISGMLSITGSNASTPYDYYYYFYDWEVQEKGCASSRTPAKAEIFANPAKPVISQNGNELSTNAGYSAYQWYFENNPIPGANNNTITPTDDGNYSVKITDQNGCTSMSDNYFFNGTDIHDDLLSGNINLYPNPNDGRFSLIMPTAEKNSIIRIMNLQGQTIYQKEIENIHGRYVESINLKGYSKGMYYIRIFSDKNIYQGKFIIK